MTTPFRVLSRRSSLLISMGLLPVSPLWAQSGGGSVWLISYAVIVFLVALGLLIILRPSGRRERAKTEQ